MRFSDKLWCSLACVGLLASPASARALDTIPSYAASIYQGKSPTPVGTLTFDSDSDIPFSACVFEYQWMDPPLSARGFVDELKTLAHRGCLDNALADFPTILVLDSNSNSFGIDASPSVQQVFAMTLGETSQGTLSGTIQFTSASSVVSSIQMKPE